MRNPQRYISLNTNIAWKLEGAVYTLIDMKNVTNITTKDNQIEIDYLCEQCTDIHTVTAYLSGGFLLNLLIILKLERLVNAWATYKEKKERYSIRHSNKEVHTSMLYMLDNDDDADIE